MRSGSLNLEKCDVFALGVILINLVCGIQPFDASYNVKKRDFSIHYKLIANKDKKTFWNYIKNNTLNEIDEDF